MNKIIGCLILLAFFGGSECCGSGRVIQRTPESTSSQADSGSDDKGTVDSLGQTQPAAGGLAGQAQSDDKGPVNLPGQAQASADFFIE